MGFPGGTGRNGGRPGRHYAGGMHEDRSAHLIARLRRPGVLTLAALTLGLQVLLVLDNLSRADLPLTLLSSVGLVVGAALLALVALRRVAPESLAPLVLWYAAGWFLLSTLGVLWTGRPLGTQPYLSHLVLVAAAYTLLPLLPAGVVAAGSAAILAAVGFTRPAPDSLLLASVLYLGVLMSFMTVYGRAIRDQRVRAELAWDLQVHDALTGLLNRRAALERLRAAFRTGTDHRHTALLLLNVDDFQGLNDTFGRPAGDDVLRHLAQTLRGGLDDTALVARWGGDEFLVLAAVPGGPRAACAWAEDLRAQLRAVERGRGYALTLSGGLVVLAETDAPDQALALAGARLLTAKIRGRDRLVCHQAAG